MTQDEIEGELHSLYEQVTAQWRIVGAINLPRSAMRSS
jgi:hypothetical protein